MEITKIHFDLYIVTLSKDGTTRQFSCVATSLPDVRRIISSNPFFSIVSLKVTISCFNANTGETLTFTDEHVLPASVLKEYLPA